MRHLRSILPIVLILQVLYLGQIYPFAHLHATRDAGKLHFAFMARFVPDGRAGPGDSQLRHEHRHQHQHAHNGSDSGTTHAHGSGSAPLAADAVLNDCDNHGSHHPFSTDYLARGQQRLFSLPAAVWTQSAGLAEPPEPVLRWTPFLDPAPPDAPVETLRAPRPPPRHLS